MVFPVGCVKIRSRLVFCKPFYLNVRNKWNLTFTLGFNLVNLGRNTTREIQTTSTFLSFFEEIDISSVELKERSVVQILLFITN